ncbi:MAG: helix-turn-helix domain-containing protein [Prolixibacteraceae bacterium]|jgi:AraC-like DNA-binding protein|nr:AraC family transcriptional regulator [Prolixibacteraceae bacterium]
MRYKVAYHVDEILNTNSKFYSQLDLDRGKQHITVQEENEVGFISCTVKRSSLCTINKWDSLFHKEVAIIEEVQSPVIGMHFMLQGNPIYSNSMQKSLVAENSHNIWSLSSSNRSFTSFKLNEYCSSFGIVLDENNLERYFDSIPCVLAKLYRKHLYGEEAVLSNKHLSMTPKIKMLISQIQNSFLIGNGEEDYLESKVKELLECQIEPLVDLLECRHCHMELYDVDKIYEARDRIVASIDTPPSIHELSRQVGINEKKLKYGFKQLIGNTIYGYLFEYRMNLAERLLATSNLTVSEIGCRCGYNYPSHFATAFKRKYGCSPKKFRMNVSV